MKKCINCGENNYSKYDPKFSIYRCKNCKLYFCKDVKFNKNFESSLDENSRVEALKNLRFNNYKKIIANIKKFNLKIGLEIGSSYGWFLDIAKENDIECIGIEPELTSYKLSIEKKHTVINGFYPDESLKKQFDFIIFNDVFEHIPNLEDVMKENYNILNEKGMLIINIPMSTGIFFIIAKIMYYLRFKKLFNRLWQFDFHSPHYYYFNKNNLSNFVKKYGFEFLDEHKVDVLDFSNIEKRVKMSGEIDFLGKIFIKISKYKFIEKIFNILPSDTKCFYFRKINR